MIAGLALESRHATTSPADHPGARPPTGGATVPTACPLLTSSQEIREFEFHISGIQFVASPGNARKGGDQLQHLLRLHSVGA